MILPNPTNNFFLISGPCVVESEDLMFEVAEKLNGISKSLSIPFILKGSFKKANRSKKTSFTGIGDLKALEILQKVAKSLQIPVITDIHKDEDAFMAAQYVDILQIPAFLCRQSSLLEAAAETGKVVNIKKGQFMSPQAMQFAVEKVRDSGNPNVWLTDRGTCFGYHDLVVDYRGIPDMQALDVPVIMDCTHSLQQPNQTSGVTGGRPDRIDTIAKAAIAVGVDGLFIETHPNPSIAKSDGANMLPLDQMESLLIRLCKIRAAIIS
jgi:2-dehydro-3-deoxyphosphooctonate aldolase (KDO 8-P synthase)